MASEEKPFNLNVVSQSYLITHDNPRYCGKTMSFLTMQNAVHVIVHFREH